MSFSIDLEIEGLTDVLDNVDELELEVQAAVQRAVMEVAKNILHEAKMRVPVDTGNLKSSGDIKIFNVDHAVVEFTADYAVYVHEDLSVNHPNGEAKFLENAVRVEVQNVDEIVKRELKKVLG